MHSVSAPTVISGRSLWSASSKLPGVSRYRDGSHDALMISHESGPQEHIKGPTHNGMRCRHWHGSPCGSQHEDRSSCQRTCHTCKSWMASRTQSSMPEALQEPEGMEGRCQCQTPGAFDKSSEMPPDGAVGRALPSMKTCMRLLGAPQAQQEASSSFDICRRIVSDTCMARQVH